MKRILLTIAYDGTNYSGWQKQKDEAVITVEGELTKALRLLFRNPALECVGASRTDAGVHALGQRAVIDVETSIPAEKIPLAIRSFLACGYCGDKGGGSCRDIFTHGLTV